MPACKAHGIPKTWTLRQSAFPHVLARVQMAHDPHRQVAQLREALKEVAEMKADVTAHVAALEQTQQELDMAEEPTDFGAVLDEAAGQMAEDHRRAPEARPNAHWHDTERCVAVCDMISAALGCSRTGTSCAEEKQSPANMSLQARACRGLAAAELREFDEAVAGGEEIEEDDDLQIERGGDLAPNAACPISSIGVRTCVVPTC